MKRIDTGRTRNLMLFIAVAFLLATVISSCNDELDFGEDTEMSEDGLIRVKANIDMITSTRSTTRYIEEGPIDDGTFNLMYQYNYSAGSSYYTRADVSFGHPEAPTTGFATVQKDGRTKEMKWTDIIYTREIKMMLTNADPQYIRSYSSSYVYFNDTGENASPYVMGPLDTELGTNDLLVTTLTPTYNTKEITAHLTHKLSLARVNIKVYPAEDGHKVVLDRAKVYITNLKPRLYSLYMSNGNVYGITGDLTEMNMVVPQVQKWGEITKSEVDTEGYDQYITVDFVLPPQTLSTGTSHPRLVVEVPMEDVTGSSNHAGLIQTYSSDLPPVMFRDNPDDEETEEDGLGAAYTLSFISGNRLNISAYINSPETELYFAPARVESWISKSSHNVNCDQSGIYNADDFYNLIESYKRRNESQLERYGYKMADGTYIFQFWGSITLEKELIEREMLSGVNPEIPFEFHFNNYAITIAEENGDESILSGNFGQTELYNLVTGSDMEQPKIDSAQDIRDLMVAIRSKDKDVIAKFGYYYDYDDRWVFEVTKNVTVNIADVFQKVDPDEFPSNMVFNYNGNNITINFGSGKTLTSTSGNGILNRILLTTCGVKDAADFSLMTRLYTEFYPTFPDILKLYGQKTEDADHEWEILVLNAMTLQGDDIFGSMVPDESHPTYKYAPPGTLTNITVTGEGYNNTFDLRYNYTLLLTFTSAGGALSTYSYLYGSLVTYYNNRNPYYLWQYGFFDKEMDKWVFRIRFSRNSITYSNLVGKLIPDEMMLRKDYAFIIDPGYSITVSSVPTAAGATKSIVLEGDEGADILYQIMRGIYTPE